jgi:hypothetical protein
VLTRAAARRHRADSAALATGTATLGGRALRIRSVVVQGRPLVFYSDLPAAVQGVPVDPTRITLREE